MSQSAQQRYEEALLYLAEMFPDRSIEFLQQILLSSPSSATIQQLVEQVLKEDEIKAAYPTYDEEKKDETNERKNEELTDSESASVSARTSRRRAPEAWEMISLVPPSTISMLQHEGSSSSSFLSPSASAPSLSPRQEHLQHILANLHSELLSSSLSSASKSKCLTALAHICSNLLVHTHTEKYRVLPLRNASFQNKVAVLTSAVSLLNAIGFQRLGSGDDEMLILKEEDLDLELIADAKKGIESDLNFIQEVLIGQSAASTTPSAPSPLVRKYDHIGDNPLYQTKQEWKRQQITPATGRPVSSIPVSTRLSREQLAAIAEHRLHPNTTPSPSLPASSSTIRAGRIMDLQHNRHLRDEITAMRKDHKERWQNTTEGRKRTFTLTDLAAMEQRDMEARAKMGTAMLHDDELLEIGKEAVRLTNEYRRSVGIHSELLWHQSLAEIGWKHSSNMGQGHAPFNHDGFDDRARAYPFSHRGAGENLFMCQGIGAASVAKQAVDGWINSPGHRKNLEGDWFYCGIGVYRNYEGAYYLTQLFAKL